MPHTYWEMHYVKLRIEVQVVGELRCGVGSGGLEKTEERSKLGKSLCTESSSSSADCSSQLSHSLIAPAEA